MTSYRPLSHEDLVLILDGYPPEAEILLDYPSDLDAEGEFEVAPRLVGQVLEHLLTKPRQQIPRLPTPRGEHIVVGAMFGVETPILLLALCDRM